MINFVLLVTFVAGVCIGVWAAYGVATSDCKNFGAFERNGIIYNCSVRI